MATRQEAKPPSVPLELLTWLERVYPDKAPEPDLSDRDIWIKVGQVQVVRNLRRHYEKANTIT